jgi:hypothetical protein
MRTLHAAVLAVSALSLGFGLGQAAPKVSSYVDASYGFRISPPACEPLPKDMQAIPVQFFGPAKDGFASNVNILIQHVATTREEYLANSEKQIAAMGGTILVKAPRTVNGWDAEEFEYQGTMQGRPLHWLALAVIGKEQVHLVTCTATESGFAEREKEFRACLASFALDVSKAPLSGGK